MLDKYNARQNAIPPIREWPEREEPLRATHFGGFANLVLATSNRDLRIRLLGGFFMWVSSLYCEPKKGVFRRARPEATGLYIELAQFGFGKGITPAVQSTVSRQAALSPSFRFAANELARNGLRLDAKSVRRISRQCGENLLELRKHRIVDWREKEMTPENSLAGKRVSVQIDGGRTRLRESLRPAIPASDNPDSDGLLQQDAAARSKRVSKSRFAPQWRALASTKRNACHCIGRCGPCFATASGSKSSMT